jgi:hypothetical protein
VDLCAEHARCKKMQDRKMCFFFERKQLLEIIDSPYGSKMNKVGTIFYKSLRSTNYICRRIGNIL